MNQKRIWIITELFYPEETAVAFIFTRIANFLSKSYKVCVICGPEFYDNSKKEFVDDVHISHEIEIYRTKSLNLDKNSILQRTIKIIILSFRMGALMCKKIAKGEIVILATNPAPLLLFVSLIKVYKKIQLHILVHDVFPENAISAKIINNDKFLIYKILKYLFDKSYSCADHLIVIGRDMKEVVSGKVVRFKKHPYISVVPNWSNPDKFPMTNFKKEDNIIVLQYAGNIGRVQGIVEILDAFRLSNDKNLYLNFRGTGALYSYIENYIQKYNFKNISLNGSFSRLEENEILARCDIGIVSLSAGMFGLGVPSKSYHLLSAGKPILFIGEPETEISCLVLENNIGWSLDIRDQNRIVEFFNNLSSIDKDVIINMGKNARDLAEKVYNEPIILELLQSKIESIKN
jgi:hypothetical protein